MLDVFSVYQHHRPPRKSAHCDCAYMHDPACVKRKGLHDALHVQGWKWMRRNWVLQIGIRDYWYQAPSKAHGDSLCYESKVARLGALQEDVNKHRNQPVLRLQKDQSDHNLGEAEEPDVQVQATESVPDHAQEESQQVTTLTTASEPDQPNNGNA